MSRMNLDQSRYQGLKNEMTAEVNEFFNNHIRTLESELRYKDHAATQKYLNDGVFATQYTRFLKRLSNKMKSELKRIGKRHLEEIYGDRDDALDLIIAFVKEAEQFYVKQEQLQVKKRQLELDKTSAYTKGIGAGLLTAALTFGLGILVTRSPILLLSAAGTLGTVVGSNRTRRILDRDMKTAEEQQRDHLYAEVKEAFERSRHGTLRNGDEVIRDFEQMMARFEKGIR